MPCMRWDMRETSTEDTFIFHREFHTNHTTSCIRIFAYKYYLLELELVESQDAQKRWIL